MRGTGRRPGGRVDRPRVLRSLRSRGKLVACDPPGGKPPEGYIHQWSATGFDNDSGRVPRYSRTGSSDGGSSSVMVCSVPGALWSLACRRKIAVAAHAEEASRSQPQEHLMRQLGRGAVTGGPGPPGTCVPAREMAWLREGTSEAERARFQSTAMITPASRPKVWRSEGLSPTIGGP